MSAPPTAFQLQFVSLSSADGEDPRGRARRVLREHRVLGAIREAGADRPDADLLLPTTEDGVVLALDEQHRLRFDLDGVRLRELFAHAELHLDLGEETNPLDGLPHEGARDDLVIGLPEDETDAQTTPHDDPAVPVATDAGAHAVRVAEFSRRGPWAARLTAQILRTPVDYSESGSWSLYRYRTDRPHAVVTGGRTDGVIVEVNLPVAGDPWVEVTTPSGGTALLWPEAERDTRPVFDLDEIRVPESAELYRRLLNHVDGTAEELAELRLGAPHLDVERALAACRPEAAGGIVGKDARMRALVSAFGVPADLVDRALADAPAAATSRYRAEGWGHLIRALIVGGFPELTPLTRRDRLVARLSRGIHARPALGAAISTAELAAGLALTRGRSRGAKILGILVALDAVADLVIWVLRTRRR